MRQPRLYAVIRPARRLKRTPASRFWPFPGIRAQAPHHMRRPSPPRRHLCESRVAACARGRQLDGPGGRLGGPRHASEPLLHGREDAPNVVPLRGSLRNAPGRLSRNPNASALALNPSISQPNLGSITGRRPASRAAWQFSIPPYWASDGTRPGPCGTMAIIVPGCGKSWAPPGVTVAAYVLLWSLRDARLCKLYDFAVLGVVPARVPGRAEYAGIDDHGAARGIVAGHQSIISRSTAGSICDMRRRHHDLPYGRSSSHRFGSPGR